MALKEKKKNQQKNFSKSHSSTRTWYLGHRSSCRIQQTLHPPHDSSCLSNDAAHHLAETSFGQAPPCGASQIMISLTILTSLTGRTHQQMFLALRKLLEKVCTQKKLFPPLRMHPLLPFPNIHTHTSSSEYPDKKIQTHIKGLQHFHVHVQVFLVLIKVFLLKKINPHVQHSELFLTKNVVQTELGF